MVDLSDRILTSGYTGAIGPERKKDIIDAIVLHSAVRIIPMLQQVCDGLKLYGFQDLLAQHSETCLQIFVPGYLKKVDAEFLELALAPIFREEGSLRHHRECRIINFLQDFIQKLEDAEEELATAEKEGVGTYFTYLRLPPNFGHRPRTRALQSSRSWANFSSCPHVWPDLFTSASRSRRQLFLGLPLFLFPCGFQKRACLTMLDAGLRRVWPTHLQRLWRISSSIGCCPVRCHISMLLMVFGQRTLRIRLRQVLIKDCIFFVVATVVLQVSAPYSRTGFIIALKILILVFLGSSEDPQTFFS
ncbi:uncharacterized protein LOC120471939 [Pimephales promelas]|uniref:uncharacterized protein LOC120471939 n=1 Tax=Pimephales promelas TaxID=90988 RepID=UPI001955C756|nr:uncharacterized protein LOC120471939 [Pimephales promelas]